MRAEIFVHFAVAAAFEAAAARCQIDLRVGLNRSPEDPVEDPEEEEEPTEEAVLPAGDAGEGAKHFRLLLLLSSLLLCCCSLCCCCCCC